MSKTTPASPDAESPERRKNFEVREIFESAYTLIEPFFDWGGKPLEYMAFQRLCESYPQISHENIRIIITVAERVYHERHPR